MFFDLFSKMKINKQSPVEIKQLAIKSIEVRPCNQLASSIYYNSENEFGLDFIFDTTNGLIQIQQKYEESIAVIAVLSNHNIIKVTRIDA